MSNVKVNGNNYNDVTSVKLMKADGSGYAEYVEGAEATGTLIKTLLNPSANLGNIEGDDAAPCLEWMNGYTVGTISFPYATTVKGACGKITAENVLLPNVSTISAVSCGKNGWRSYGFGNCKITGVLDLSKLATVMNNACQFSTSEIGTLKLGSYAPMANIWNACTITNLVWSGLTPATFENTNLDVWLTYFNAATIANLYVPSDCVSIFREKIDSGKLTKITNLYSIDEWED